MSSQPPVQTLPDIGYIVYYQQAQLLLRVKKAIFTSDARHAVLTLRALKRLLFRLASTDVSEDDFLFSNFQLNYPREGGLFRFTDYASSLVVAIFGVFTKKCFKFIAHY